MSETSLSLDLTRQTIAPFIELLAVDFADGYNGRYVEGVVLTWREYGNGQGARYSQVFAPDGMPVSKPLRLGDGGPMEVALSQDYTFGRTDVPDEFIRGTSTWSAPDATGPLTVEIVYLIAPLDLTTLPNPELYAIRPQDIRYSDNFDFFYDAAPNIDNFRTLSLGAEDDNVYVPGVTVARVSSGAGDDIVSMIDGDFDGGTGTDELILPLTSTVGLEQIFAWSHGDAVVFYDSYTARYWNTPFDRHVATWNVEKVNGQTLVLTDGASGFRVQDGFASKAATARFEAPMDLSAITDIDGNDLGADAMWRHIGAVDLTFNDTLEHVYLNTELGRLAKVTLDRFSFGAQSFDFPQNGTRVLGVYADPLIAAGIVERLSDFDSERRFQNDLLADNLSLVDAFDFDADGRQEVYWKTNDGTAYLRAIMHRDGELEYANYQNSEQVEEYLTGLGYGQEVVDTILG